jgi:putative endopeptidase
MASTLPLPPRPRRRRPVAPGATLLLPVLVAVLAGPRPARAQQPAARSASATVAIRIGAAPRPAGVDTSGMDRAVAPGNDFFAYANGTWLKRTTIPADLSSTGVFNELAERTSEQVAGLIRGLAQANPPAGSDERRIRDYYQSYLDEAAIDARGTAPLKPLLDSIAGIRDRRELAQALGRSLRADVDIFNATDLHTSNLFGLWVAQDLDDPAHYSPFLVQGGLGMPDREYYLDPTPRMADIRTKYQAHIATMLRLAGFTDAGARAARVMGLEHRIAEAHWTRAASEEIARGNNHMTVAELQRRAPGLDWAAYFQAAGLGGRDRFVVWQPSAFTGIAALVGSVPLDTWKDFLAFHAIDQRAGVLPRSFQDESFAFYGRVLSGTPELSARWKRAVSATNGALGFAVGKLYVARYFPPAAKAQVDAMVHDLLTAFGARIDALAWMSPATKAKAKAKLAVLKVGIGYPDRWPDYAGLRVVPGDAFGNAERAQRFELQRSLARLSQPVDRGRWMMTPQTVNAVNLPALNALNFPAAILQPPFFDPARPAAVNYGAIGSVIGHEISHSFDDQGAQFDATGRLRNWWTPADLQHFHAAAARLVKQYDAYRPFPDLAVNGTQTLSENIADVAGVAAAHDAWKLSLHGRPAPASEGFTGDQQFFLAFAQNWRRKSREEALRQQILTDGHAPAQYRADTVRNIDAWYAAFGVQPGQKLALAPPDRVRIW